MLQNLGLLALAISPVLVLILLLRRGGYTTTIVTLAVQGPFIGILVGRYLKDGSTIWGDPSMWGIFVLMPLALVFSGFAFFKERRGKRAITAVATDDSTAGGQSE